MRAGGAFLDGLDFLGGSCFHSRRQVITGLLGHAAMLPAESVAEKRGAPRGQGLGYAFQLV